MRIAIGGCYPPNWPRPPWRPEPEPEPDSLDEDVNWMTYSHPDLYAMVHTGLDVTGAMAVSAQWARLGGELSEIGDELARLLFATAQAWEGDAAELAKESVSALSDWSGETGTRATEVSGCITIQVDNVTNARNDMPPPPYPVVDRPMPSQVTAFTSNDFELAKPLVVDPTIYTTHERRLHEQAAETMQRFQRSSADVYATVPQFAPPDLRKMPFGPPVEPLPLPPQPPPPPVPPVPPPVPIPGGGSGGGGGPVSGGPAGGPGSAGSPRPAPGPLAPGGGAGGGESRPAAAATPQPARPAAAGAPPPGGVPMGGAPGAGRGDDETERKTKYVQENDDLWGLGDQPVMPSVIGEVNRRA